MKKWIIPYILLGLVLTSCSPTIIPETGSNPALPAAESLPVTASMEPEVADVLDTATAVPPSTQTLQTTATGTPSPEGLIRVDTLEQEVYPFVENNLCSLAEAIIAANLKKSVDSCPAGGEESSIIELMPGTYRLTRIDATPHQVDWAYSTTGTGNALPAIVRTLTLRGNSAVLSREDASEPFRILEVLYGTLTLENITLQGGEVREEDWGGAMLVANASLVMDGVTVKDSRAENGGGVQISNGGLVIRNSEFSGNTAFFSGGGLYADQVKAEITNSRFFDNKTDAWGAGAFIEHGDALVTDSLFTGNHSDSRGGGINLQVVNATVLRSQFYNNYAKTSGAGVSGRNYIYEDDIKKAEEDPMIVLMQSDTYKQMATQFPGLRETLMAQPSGVFQQRDLSIEVHDSCFKGNTDLNNDPMDISTAIAGLTSSENNYYGDPSGPSGMGNGKGDAVGGLVTFEPYLTEPPAHCDLSLAEK
jgi:predicted outer membrane repeat protein